MLLPALDLQLRGEGLGDVPGGVHRGDGILQVADGGDGRLEHHVRDVSFGEDAFTSRTGNGPTNLATLRSTVKAAILDAGYLHVPDGRRDHTTATETLYLHGLID